MAEERINRKLAAILTADVVGYSRLMASDEAGTLAALKRHRQTVFEPAQSALPGGHKLTETDLIELSGLEDIIVHGWLRDRMKD